jgi:hypothetical protein
MNMAAMLLSAILCLANGIQWESGTHLRRRDANILQRPYYTLSSSELGNVDVDAAIGNPMKGLMESPRYTIPKKNYPFYE